MNYDINELMKRMAAGESAEAIAAEMTDALNAAVAKRAEEEAAAKAKEAAEKRKTYCRIELGDLLSDLYNFIEEYYPDLVAEFADMPEEDIKELKNITVQAILEALDKTVAQLKNPTLLDPRTLALLEQLTGAPAQPKSTPVYKKPNKPKSDDDILNDFLSKICH